MQLAWRNLALYQLLDGKIPLGNAYLEKPASGDLRVVSECPGAVSKSPGVMPERPGIILEYQNTTLG